MPVIKNESKYDTNLLLRVKSSRKGGVYEVHRFYDYTIDFDIETDADIFSFRFSNPATIAGTANNTHSSPSRVGLYNGLFTRFDTCEISLNGTPIIYGFIDNIKYGWSTSSNYIDVTGRGLSALLIDNDATPATKKNIAPASYISERCSAYGLKAVSKLDIPVRNEYVINAGSSEITVMHGLVDEHRQKLWCELDTIYTGKWSTDATPSYLFARGLKTGKRGIPIENIEISEGGGSTIKSEVSIYGSTSDGSEKIVGTATNDKLKQSGINRKGTELSTDENTVSQYITNAQTDMDELFRESYTINLTTKMPGDQVILPNKTCQIIDTFTMTNVIMFITKVKYSKSTSNGSTISITTIPSDGCLKALMDAQGTAAGGLVGIETDVAQIHNIRKG